MKLPHRIVLLGLAVLALPACGAATAPSSDGPDGTLEGKWVLASGTVDGTRLEQPTGSTVTLVVERDQASGVSACNQYSGTAQVDGSAVTFSGLGGTEMGCDPPIMKLEQDYLTALAAVSSAANDGDQLVLTGEALELRFDPVAPVEASPLIGTVWQLQSLLSGTGPDGTASSTVGRDPRVEFSADGRMSGSTGCNGFSGTFEMTGDVVEPDRLGATLMACPGVEAQESHVMGVLGDRFTVLIDGDQLTITGADGRGLQYLAERPGA